MPAVPPDNARREALQQAIAELARQREEIARLRGAAREPIAIVGMACRLPGASTLDEFWDLLARGGDAVGEVPRDRWDAGAFYDPDPSVPGRMATRQGAFTRGVDQFDAPFFGIAPREAQNMDPQQRLLLEVAWEALEHASIPPTSLYGTATGVFVGITCFDHAIRISRDPGNFNAYAGTGSALNMAPGRLSYVLGLTGPSMAVDTACSSSLVCLHLACQSLRQRECDTVIAAGVHLMLSPDVMVSFSQARMLAGDGRSKTFDASADGYGRGEGCGVVVLKRYADALADGDRVFGVIRGTAVNQDGPSGGLTVPNGASQQQVIRRALDAAGLAPASVAYVEAHGTGTPLGDPIEVEALARVYGEGRAASDPLLIGSVKTNIGHLEPAAGMAALIKVLLAFEHERIPAHLHFRTPNPHIPWDAVPIAVTSRAHAWPRGAAPRLAGVSAFGFSGTNAHVIVEEPPARAPRASEDGTRRMRLLPLSAKSEDALRAVAARYAARLAGAAAPDFAAIAFTAGAGRAHFPHRLAIVADSADDARGALEAFAAGRPSVLVRSARAASADYRRDAKDVKARLARAYDELAAPGADHREALAAVAALYLEGVAIDWPRLYGGAAPERVPLPSYPFQRERCWVDLPEPAAATTPLDGWCYQLEWAALPPTPAAIERAVDRRWAVVSGDAALAEAVRERLVSIGATASAVADAGDVDTGVTDVVFIAPARAASDAAETCADLLALAQRAASAGAAPRVSVVTRGAFPIGGMMTMAGAAQAPVAAFSRVVGLEHPELGGRVVDLDPGASPEDADAVIAAILDEDGEDQVAIRGGVRYGQRIARAHAPARSAPPLRADAAYLITGGLGRIGLLVAADVARRGARRLWLVGRHGASTPEQRAAIAALEEQGVRVRVVEADVADRAVMEARLRELTADAPLAGVVHAAGLPGYADIERLTAAGVAGVLRPKVQGAWTLHELTLGMPLDFFVGFSSIASAWGSRGQAHYAAGNAFLDALAHLRRAEGKPAVAINWGPWEGGGMTSPEAAALLRRVGIAPLAPARALEALAAFASGDRAQVVVADIDWPLFRGSYEARGHRRLLERLDGAPDRPESGGAANDLTRAVVAAAPAARERLLADIIQREVAAVLELPASARADLTQGLFEMGMDSLMALELRTRLQTLVSRALPATLVFDYPTIQAIARFLAAEIAGREAVPAAAPEPRADLDALSDADAEALLLKKLESIH